MSEQVLVVPTELFRECGYFEGYHPGMSAYKRLFDPNNQSFMDRAEAEENPEWKQLIPYIVIQDDTGMFASYWRGKGQGEKRLHGKRSIGIGGHINPCDDVTEVAPVASACQYHEYRYMRGVVRELHEEITFSTHPLPPPFIPKLGLLNDDQTEVGKVHLGVVHKLTLPSDIHIVGVEPDIDDFKWCSEAELLLNTGDFESWSQLCLDAGLCAPNTITMTERPQLSVPPGMLDRGRPK
jgi:predicted NUDIX family phosphoesterase